MPTPIKHKDTSRRQFLAKSSEMGLASMLTASLSDSEKAIGEEAARWQPPTESAPNAKKQMPRRKLGATGVEVRLKPGRHHIHA